MHTCMHTGIHIHINSTFMHTLGQTLHVVLSRAHTLELSAHALGPAISALTSCLSCLEECRAWKVRVRWQSWVLRKQIKVTLHQLKRTIATTWENLLYKTVLPCGRDMEQNMRNRHQHRPGFSKRKNIECPRCKSFRNDGANMCSKFVLTSFQPLSLSAVMRSVPFRQWMCQHILKEWVLLTGRRLIRRQPLVPLLFVLKFWTTCVIKLVVIWFALAQ